MKSKSTTIWNGELGVALGPRVRASFEAFNFLNSAVSDIDY